MDIPVIPNILQSTPLQYGALALCLVLILVNFAMTVVFVKVFMGNQKVLLGAERALGRNSQVLEAVLTRQGECTQILGGVQMALKNAASELTRHGCSLGEVLAQCQTEEQAQALDQIVADAE